jgi:CheY-like chemotaxis protein
LKVLVLDDSRQEQFKERLSSVGMTDVVYTASAAQCIKALTDQQFDLIFLDYDLTYMEIDKPSSENTGAVVARWLSEHKMNPNHNAHIVIHSVDPHGSQYMNDFLPQATIVPGVWLEDQFKGLIKRFGLDIL